MTENPLPDSTAQDWVVYMVRCVDGSLYTGIARDVLRRVAEHNHDNRAASRYTRSRRPVVLVYRHYAGNRSEAARQESAIKQMSRAEKEALIRRATG